jgi:hypothetical protein
MIYKSAGVEFERRASDSICGICGNTKLKEIMIFEDLRKPPTWFKEEKNDFYCEMKKERERKKKEFVQKKRAFLRSLRIRIFCKSKETDNFKRIKILYIELTSFHFFENKIR